MCHPASPTGNLRDCREGQGVHVSFSRQLNAFRNVSVSHVNSKSDLGTEISTQRHWLDITQLKIKCILSKWKLQFQDPWVTYSEIPAYTGASSRGIVGYEIKCHVYFFCTFTSETCFDVGGIDGGGKTSSAKSSMTCSRHCQQVADLPMQMLNPCPPFKGQLARYPRVDWIVCATFFWVISIHYGAVFLDCMPTLAWSMSKLYVNCVISI